METPAQLNQQAQQWLARRQQILLDRQQSQQHLLGCQWKQTSEVNPDLLQEPLRSTVRQLLGLPTSV